MKTPEERIKDAQELTDVQCSPGTYDQGEYMRGMANGMKVLMSCLDDKEPEFFGVPDNLVPEALNILQRAMEDKSEGELYYGWLCNIKFAVYDTIKQSNLLISVEEDLALQNDCEEGAKLFLTRLLSKDEPTNTDTTKGK